MNRGRMDQVVEMAKWSMVDFDSVKNQIVFRIINGRMNEKELQSLAHIPVMNLAVIFVEKANTAVEGAYAMINYEFAGI